MGFRSYAIANTCAAESSQESAKATLSAAEAKKRSAEDAVLSATAAVASAQKALADAESDLARVRSSVAGVNGETVVQRHEARVAQLRSARDAKQATLETRRSELASKGVRVCACVCVRVCASILASW
jgi:hypothetical protein